MSLNQTLFDMHINMEAWGPSQYKDVVLPA